MVSSCAGKIVNIRHLDEVITSINGWYMERGLFGLVSASYMSILSLMLKFVHRCLFGLLYTQSLAWLYCP